MPGLTGLRGVAALAVVLYHVHFEYKEWAHLGATLPGLRFGWVGVDLFFVLSAYLLTRLHLSEGGGWLGRAEYTRYLWRRYLRIAPAYYLSIPVSLALLERWWVVQERPVTLLEHLLYVQNMDPQAIGAINALYWTLAIEFQFYLLLPLLVPWVRRRPQLVALVAMAAAVAWRWGFYDAALPGLGSYSLPAFMGHFALGMAVAVMGSSDAPLRRPDLWSLGALGVMAVALVAGTPAGSPDQADSTRWANTTVRPVLAFALAALVHAASGPHGLFARAVASRPLHALGLMSYSLYLVHVPVILALRRVPELFGEGFWLYSAAATAASLAAGAAFYLAVERPSLHLRRRMAPRRRPQEM